MAGGRPSTLTAAVVNDLKKYLKSYQDHEHKIPSVSGFCSVHDLRRSTVYYWADVPDEEKRAELVKKAGKKKPTKAMLTHWARQAQFSDMLARLNEEQETRLLNMGLSGEFNPTITKLVLAKHGYHEKQEIDQNVHGDMVILYEGVEAEDVDPRRPAHKNG